MDANQVIAEQELGKNLYQKHKIDFKQELEKGKIPKFEINNTPLSMLKNIQIGIAYESLKEEEYKIAEAFFTQLGESYKEQANYAVEMDRRTQTKKEEDEKPKSLTEKLELINNCKSKFEYSRETIDKIAQNHPLAKKVSQNETTFTETISLYEKEFYNLNKVFKLRRVKKEKIQNYNENMKELLKSFGKFANIHYKLENLDPKEYKKTKILQPLCVGGVFPSMLSAFGFFAYAMAINPLLVLGVFPFVFGSAALATKGDCLGAKRKQMSLAFTNLKKSASEIDSLIHKTYITNHYRSNAELFKENFVKLEDVEKKYVIGELLKMEKNKELDAWLGQTHPKLIEDEGWWRLVRK